MKIFKLLIPLSAVFISPGLARGITPGPVPEPGILLLLGAGLVAVAAWGYWRRRKKTSSKP